MKRYECNKCWSHSPCIVLVEDDDTMQPNNCVENGEPTNWIPVVECGSFKMTNLFNVGDQISGFCNGYFGRDDYEAKTCTYVCDKYAVFAYESGEATVLNYEHGLESCDLSADWNLVREEKR